VLLCAGAGQIRRCKCPNGQVPKLVFPPRFQMSADSFHDLEAHIRTLRALRAPPWSVRCTIEMLLLLLGLVQPRSHPSDVGAAPRQWTAMREALRKAHCAALIDAFDPALVSLDALERVVAYLSDERLSEERIARASAAASSVWRWCDAQTLRAKLIHGQAAEAAGEDDDEPYGSDDFEGSEDEGGNGSGDGAGADDGPSAGSGGRQLGEEQSEEHRTDWREQQAALVARDDFPSREELRDSAMLETVIKFLGAAGGGPSGAALPLVERAVAALDDRLQRALAPPADTTAAAAAAARGSAAAADDSGVPDVASGEDEESNKEEAPPPQESLGELLRGVVEHGGVHRLVTLLGCHGHPPLRRRAARLLSSLQRAEAELLQTEEGKRVAGVSDVLEEAGGGTVAVDAVRQLLESEQGGGSVALDWAEVVLSAEGAADCWGLESSTSKKRGGGGAFPARAAFGSRWGGGVVAEGMELVGLRLSGAAGTTDAALRGYRELRRAAGKLHAGRDYWAGRYSTLPPFAVASTVGVPAESAAPTCVAPQVRGCLRCSGGGSASAVASPTPMPPSGEGRSRRPCRRETSSGRLWTTRCWRACSSIWGARACHGCSAPRRRLCGLGWPPPPPPRCTATVVALQSTGARRAAGRRWRCGRCARGGCTRWWDGWAVASRRCEWRRCRPSGPSSQPARHHHHHHHRRRHRRRRHRPQEKPRHATPAPQRRRWRRWPPS
jgi:hypothetical protein